MSGSVPEPVARPLAWHTAREAAAAMERCFEGYVVPVRVTAEGWERRFRSEHLDAFASRIYWRGDDPAAVCFVTRRGWTSRIGGMGVALAERGRGLGRRVMEEAIGAARERGDRRVLLEVIEQNPPAVALYRSLGFHTLRRLVGYRWNPGEGGPAEALEEVDPAEAARAAHAEGEAGLPWMLASETLAAAAPPAAAFRLADRAWAVVADPAAATLSLTGLVVARAHRRQGWGTRMTRALAARFPGRPWSVTAIVPEALAPEFFARGGWERQETTQWEMEREV
jgi:ribosomal protein S18 acetylase RimI-like enzyme